MDGKNLRIGLFDSGVGGLTVLRACQKELPQGKFFYYGDNGNAPYGNRPEEEIRGLTERGVGALLAEGADVVVLACNTATAVCAERLRDKLAVPVVGMEPAVKPAAGHCGRALVLATARTAESGRLRELLARFPACAFTVHAAERLAGAIERNLTTGINFTLGEHLPPGEYDGVVLGCTHYIFYRDGIAAHYGVPVYDGNGGTARRLKALVCSRAGEGKWSENTKTNKSSDTKWSEEGAERVIFLGKWAKINEKIYKQTFEI